MATKKTTAKAAPEKGKAKAKEPVVLSVVMIWTDPKTGKKYNVVEGDGSCKKCELFAEYGGNCPIDDPQHPLPCDARQVGNDKGVMFTAVSGKKPAKEQPVDDGRRYELVEVKLLKPSPYQTRKDGDVSDLAASIRTYGVLNPVTIRMVDDEYELIAGHRRWKAAVEAELTLIPAIVIVCDDQTAAEMCVTENMQHKGLSPIEEAEGVNALIATKHTLDDIANRLGRTRQWVARRASLVCLMPGIRARVEKPGDVLSQCPIEILEIMARMPYDAQDTLLGMFGNGGSIPSASTMRARAEALMCSLKNPPFSIKQCQACIKRTGVAPDLFDEIDGKLGNCLDADCYAEKALTAKQLLVEDLRRDKGDIVIVTRDWQLQQKVTGLQSVYAHTECPKEAPDAVPAVEIKEDGNVRNFFVHKPVVRESAEKVEQPKEPYETQVQRRIVKIVTDWLTEWTSKLEGKCADEDAAIQTPFNRLVDAGEERIVLRLIAAFGTTESELEAALDDNDGYQDAPLGSLLRKLFLAFAEGNNDRYLWMKIEVAYPAVVSIAEVCGFATEKQLLDLAKSGLELDGIKDPAEKPAKKGKAK